MSRPTNILFIFNLHFRLFRVIGRCSTVSSFDPVSIPSISAETLLLFLRPLLDLALAFMAECLALLPLRFLLLLDLQSSQT